MPDNAAATIQDDVIQHAVDLERVKASNVDQILAMLTALEDELVKEIAGNGTSLPGFATDAEKRAAALLEQTQDTIASVYGNITTAQHDNLRQIANLSSQQGTNVLNGGIGADVINSVALSATQLETLAGDTLIQGAKSADWWAKQSADTLSAFASQTRLGYLRGESVDEITARVRGTAAKGFTDGVLPASRRAAEALVRTSVQAVSNQSRLTTYANNADVISSIQWLATLDRRTTPICRALDGKTWTLPDYQPIGHKFPFPGVTAHWNCRSTQIPNLKSWSELSGKKVIEPGNGLDPTTLNAAFRANLAEQGLSPDKVSAAVANSRASMDGQVADTKTFGDYLADKEKASPGFAAQLLGPTRADLFNRGLVTVSDLVDKNYRTLTIPQLQQLVSDRAAQISGKAATTIPEPEPVAPPAPTVAEQAAAARASIAHLSTADAALVAEIDGPGGLQEQVQKALKAFEAAQNALYATNKSGDSYLKARELPEYLEFKRLQALRGAKLQERDAARAAARPTVEKLLEVDPTKRGSVNAQFVLKKGATGNAIRDTSTQAINILQRIIEAAKLPTNILGVTNTTRSRAFYYRGGINLKGNGSVSTALHEIGHWLEDKNPEIAKLSAQFLDRRTQGETARKLSKIFPGQGYRADEIAKEDKFSHAYMGKIYPRAANGSYSYTEILSMGLEQYWFNTTAFAASDPDYFDYVYSVLRAADINP